MKKIFPLCFLLIPIFLVQTIHAQTIPEVHKSGDISLKRGTMSKQKCKNHFINPSAAKALTAWKRKGQASVNRTGQFFTIHHTKASISQIVNIPTTAQYAYLGTYMRNSKSSSKSHGVLVVLLMDALGKPIKQIKIGKPHTGNQWKYQSEKIDLSTYKRAKKIQVFLKQSSKNTKNQGDTIHFDNLILAFDCQQKPPFPKGEIPTKNRFQKENQSKKSIID